MRMSTNCLLDTLRDCPSGLTAKEIADRLGADHSNICSRLSKLAAYGIISKTRARISSDASPCAIYFPLIPPGRPPIQSSYPELANSP
jgi:DNA-binding Lrp family transcriptional regulator